MESLPYLINKQTQVLELTDIYDIINHFLEERHSDEPFFIVNLREIIKKIDLWRAELPMIEPFYAVKCNPDDIVLTLMASMGLSFDCASKNEIAKIIKLGVEPTRIVYANPCKMVDQIKYARANDVDLMTFDSVYELYKITIYHPSAKLLIRIQTDDSQSRCQFNSKFGVTLEEVPEMLKQAKLAHLEVVGVSFHVGSGCDDPQAYRTALQSCHQVTKMAEEAGFHFSIIDVGGGFPGDDDEKFKRMATIIRQNIEEYFTGQDIRFIAEPGRFFVTAAYTLVTSVINKKVIGAGENRKLIYYLSDSVYNSFNNTVFDHAKITFQPFNERNERDYECIIFGPTCDSMDRIPTETRLPDLAIGETVYCENMGAYTLAASSNFNGFAKTECRYFIN